MASFCLRAEFQERLVTHKMTGKQWLALAGIAVAAFVFNSSEFMPVGLLTDIGKTFGTNEATTGRLV